MTQADDDSISLAEALDRYQRESGYSNAYSTLREHAARSGVVHLGTRIRVRKVHGRWTVRLKDLEQGLAAERRWRAERARLTSDYEKRILHGSDGAQIWTDWGYYQRRGAFHFVHYDRVPRWDSSGDWVCSSCWNVARTEHENPECHLCSDWNGCGRDCTLSAIRCDSCGHGVPA